MAGALSEGALQPGHSAPLVAAVVAAQPTARRLCGTQVYCLPEGYEVVERSLDDIRYVLEPSFSAEEVARLDAQVSWARALDGSESMPGLVGLNNMKANDYANVAVQVTSPALHPRPLQGRCPLRSARAGPATQLRFEI